MDTTEQQIKDLTSALDAKGYMIDKQNATKIWLALNYKGKGLSTVLLEGPAGSGKTFLVETVASIFNAKLEFYQGVATTSEEALIFDIDVAASVAHDYENVNKKGKLLKAIDNSDHGYSYLFLDEWDKTRPEMDAFLLDFLQSGRITGTSLGDFQVKNFKNLVVFIAKNDERELSEPLIRRTRSIKLTIPTPELVRSVLLRTKQLESSLDPSVISYLNRIYSKLYDNQKNLRKMVTIQELINAALDDSFLKNMELVERIENIVNWVAHYSEDRSFIITNIISKLEFYYPKSVYEDLGIPYKSYIGTETIVKKLLECIGVDNFKRKSKLCIYAAIWYQICLNSGQNDKLQVSFRTIQEAVQRDLMGANIDGRITKFFYGSKDYNFVLNNAPMFMLEDGRTIKIEKKHFPQLTPNKK